MELDEEIKIKITERLFRRIFEQIPEELNNICMELLDGKYLVNITTRGKFTIAEIKYYRNGYIHHFLGISAKNPNDVADPSHGIKVAVEEALLKLLAKFYTDELSGNK